MADLVTPEFKKGKNGKAKDGIRITLFGESCGPCCDMRFCYNDLQMHCSADDGPSKRCMGCGQTSTNRLKMSEPFWSQKLQPKHLQQKVHKAFCQAIIREVDDTKLLKFDPELMLRFQYLEQTSSPLKQRPPILDADILVSLSNQPNSMRIWASSILGF